MFPAKSLRLFFGACVCLFGAAQNAKAAEEEIAVYMDEIAPAGAFGLELNINHAIEGRRTRDYPEQQLSDGRVRITPELAYALSSRWEVGVLPLAAIDRTGAMSVDGLKARIRYVVAAKDGQGPFWGANLEAGRVSRRLSENAWGAELRLIAGLHTSSWSLATNLIVEQALSGPNPETELELASSAFYALTDNISIGLESYNALGNTDSIGPLSRDNQRVYAVVETGARGWDFNFGVGYGYGAPEDRWVVKAIVGVPLGAPPS